METFQLRYFTAVIRRGSLTAAAADCHVSQPSLSTQIKNLETELGVKLLERKARGVIPTKAGERLLLTAQRLLAEVDECRRDIRRRNFAGLPGLRIGIQPLLAAVLLPRPLARFLAGRDSYQIIVRELSHPDLVDALSSQTIDLGFTSFAHPRPPRLQVRELLPLRYGAFCLSGHPLTRTAQPRLRHLLPHRLALFNDPANLVERISQSGMEAGSPARIIFSSDQAMTVFEMAAAGLGVAVLPLLLEEWARRRRMAVLPLHDRNLGFPVVATWNRDRPAPPGMEALVQACGEC